MPQQVMVVPEGKVVDYIDRKLRNDTPEEYVRQNIEKRLVNELKYARNQIRVEYTVAQGTRRARADLVVFPPAEAGRLQEDIFIIIECKKASIEPSDKKEGVKQLKSYMAACVNCEWGMWTNGKYKAVYRRVTSPTGKVEYIDYNDIPSADGRIDEIDRPKRNRLRNAVEDNLLFVFRTCHNHIYVTDGMQKQPAFFELLKVIFCKIEDERNLGSPLEFYAASKERSSPDGQLTVQKRIHAVFDRVKRKYPAIFDPADEIRLKPRSLAYVVSELQAYSLLNTHIDIKGKAYEELVGSNLRGDRGEFFTPRNIARLTVEMLSPHTNEKVLDPACGTGGFLVIAMNKVTAELERDLSEESGRARPDWSDDDKRAFLQRIAEIATSNFFGFDINPDLVKATKMNMVMNNDGSGNIFQANSLLPPHEWESEFRRGLARSLGVKESSLRGAESIGLFDVIVTNPPFGSKIPIKDPHILEQYEIAHIWRKDNSKPAQWSQTERLQGSVPPDQLFIERCLQFLRPGGRLGIVLPDSILGAPGLTFIRQWLLSRTRVLASVDLHADTFQPHNGTQTSVLFLQKRTPEELHEQERTGLIPDYEIFMAMVDRVGHDKRGNPLFKRDEAGREILAAGVDDWPVEAGASPLDRNVRAASKVLDDQTPLVSSTFEMWRREEGLSW